MVFPAVGLGVNPIVRVGGSPDTVNATGPVKPGSRAMLIFGNVNRMPGGCMRCDVAVIDRVNGPACAGAPVTVSWIVRFCGVTPAPLPITVIDTVPRGAEALAVNVMVLLVCPAGTDTGLASAVTPAGIPVGCRLTGPLNVPVLVTVMVTVLVPPRATELVVLLAEIV